MNLQEINNQNLELYRAIRKIFSLPEGKIVLKALEHQCGIYECSPYQTCDEALFFNTGKKFPYKADPYYLMYKAGQVDMFLLIKKFLDLSEKEFIEKNDTLLSLGKDKKIFGTDDFEEGENYD